jgi:hypothetical protein
VLNWPTTTVPVPSGQNRIVALPPGENVLPSSRLKVINNEEEDVDWRADRLR